MIEIKHAEAGRRKPSLAAGIEPVFLEGVSWRGKPARIFAYLGRPAGEGRHPAILLIHGGNGRAYDDWVKMWTERGFVALAPDLNAQMYGSEGDFTPNPAGGPKGYGSFDKEPCALEDTWTAFSVNLLCECAAWLHFREDVDLTKLFVHGISWGGYLTYLLLGRCRLFALAGVSYTTAYLYRDGYWIDAGLNEGQMGANYRRWIEQLDPAESIGWITTPTVWARGINDAAFSTGLVNDTLDLFRPGIVTPVFYPEYQHSQEHGCSIPEIVSAIEEAAFGGEDPGSEAVYSVVYTCGRGKNLRDWIWTEEPVSAGDYLCTSSSEWTAWYYNRRDRRDRLTSTRIYRHGI